MFFSSFLRFPKHKLASSSLFAIKVELDTKEKELVISSMVSLAKDIVEFGLGDSVSNYMVDSNKRKIEVTAYEATEIELITTFLGFIINKKLFY